MGGFIENSKPTIERFDVSRGVWEEVDILKNNRAKFSITQLSNGNILIMGGKYEGMRVALCEEFNPRENKMKVAEIILTTPKSGFGVVCNKQGIAII